MRKTILICMHIFKWIHSLKIPWHYDKKRNNYTRKFRLPQFYKISTLPAVIKLESREENLLFLLIANDWSI